MLMLWFRPQGVVPARLRRTASFGVAARGDAETGSGPAAPVAIESTVTGR
jgi:hypothetical protein